MKQKKTKEELEALKQELDNLNKKLSELSEEELEYVSGGVPLIGQGDKPTYEKGILTIPIK